jgi:hypothetical protein
LTSGCFASGRFVGWITNFIHNRQEPDVNMVRGYLFARSIAPERLESIRLNAEARGSRPPKTGFLTLSSDILDLPGKSRAGSGELKYKLHSRSHTRPLYEDATCRKVRPVVRGYVQQMLIENFEPPERILALTCGISFNGKQWRLGSGCLFYLDTDAPSLVHPHVGTVKRFLALEIDGKEQFFVEITEHTVLRWQRSVAVVDLSLPSRTRITHAGHVVSLATYAEYWQPQYTV